MARMDMIGRRFGKLTVIGDSGQRQKRCILWQCRCDCGGERLVSTGKLTGGAVTDCGCGGARRHTNMRDLTGRRFGSLTALYPVQRHDRGTATSAKWHCRCDCGKEADVYAASLLRGLTRSCGCLNQEQRARMHEYMRYGNDTCVERLIRAQKNEGENKAGFRGLSRMKDGRYRAVITFRKVHYHLGCYKDFNSAVQARLEAERILHQGYIDAYSAYQSLAETDPAWAKANPFFYEVERTDGRFVIHTNGMPELAAVLPAAAVQRPALM